MKEVLLIVIAGLLIFGIYLFVPRREKFPVAFQQSEVTGIADIVRGKETKTAFLRVNIDAPWRLFAGPSVESINMNTPILKGKGRGNYQLNVPTTRRSYFLLLSDEGSIILSEKHLPVKGCYNFRDLGGIRTKDGRCVKWGMLFRSDEPHTLTEEDIDYVSSIPFESIVDLRSTYEADAKPVHRRLLLNAQQHSFPLTPGNIWADTIDFSAMDTIPSDSLMREINRMLVKEEECNDTYRDFFALLQEKQQVPLLFHCSSGKDRSGMCAALILYALGVEKETIIQDYLLSNQFMYEKYGQYRQSYPELGPLFEAREDFLTAGLQTIEEEHGSIDRYLDKILNVDVHQLRQMYLY